MKKIQRASLSLLVAVLISNQAYAGETRTHTSRTSQATQPVAVFTETDYRSMFQPSDNPLQLAALSSREMMETEGALWANAAGGALGVTGYAFSCIYSCCTLEGFGMAFGAGALNPVRGAASVVWGFNGAVATGSMWGLGGHHGWW